MKYSKDKSKVYQLNVCEQYNRDSKKEKGTLGPVGLKKRKHTNLPKPWGKLTLNWKTATLFHRTEKLHKITEEKKKTTFPADTTPLLQGQKVNTGKRVSGP